VGMHCASCAVRIERVLARRPGVRSIEVNFATQHAELTYEPGAFDLGEAGAALDKLGYQIKPVSQEAEAQADAGARPRAARLAPTCPAQLAAGGDRRRPRLWVP